MTKKLIISTVASMAILTTCANAVSLEDRILKLENIIQKQQKTIKNLSSLNALELEDEIEELDERLETVETRSFTDKIQLGLGMRVEANNITTTYADGSKPANEDIIGEQN